MTVTRVAEWRLAFHQPVLAVGAAAPCRVGCGRADVFGAAGQAGRRVPRWALMISA